MEGVKMMSNYTNSPLVVYTALSPNHSGLRKHKIDTISIHCMAGNLSVETCGRVFAPTSRQASSNYGIGSDGRIALYVEEKNRSWCTSSSSNDNRAITIEVANCSFAPDWKVSDAALKSLILLCTDICKRNEIKKLLWCGDKSLIGQVEKQNLSVHRWFAAKACPGDYLYKLHGYICEEVNKNLDGVIYLNMTKEELKAFIETTVRGMGIGKPASTWAMAQFNDAQSKGITDGSNPLAYATRQEAAIMALRAFEREK